MYRRKQVTGRRTGKTNAKKYELATAVAGMAAAGGVVDSDTDIRTRSLSLLPLVLQKIDDRVSYLTS